MDVSVCLFCLHLDAKYRKCIRRVDWWRHRWRHVTDRRHTRDVTIFNFAEISPYTVLAHLYRILCTVCLNRKWGPGSTIRREPLSTHYRRTLCYQLIRLRTLGKESFGVTLPPSENWPIIGNVSVRWRRVGRLKLSSARANSSTDLSVCLFVHNFDAEYLWN